LFVALVYAAVPVSTQQATNPITVISAKRGKAFASPTRQIKVRNEQTDAIIMLRIGGLSREEFVKIDGESIYVMAGEEKLPPNVIATGVIDGKAELLMVVVGPKDMLDMFLHIGTYPRVAFKAEEAVEEELKG
jgi:hypothetical protein